MLQPIQFKSSLFKINTVIIINFSSLNCNKQIWYNNLISMIKTGVKVVMQAQNHKCLYKTHLNHLKYRIIAQVIMFLALNINNNNLSFSNCHRNWIVVI